VVSRELTLAPLLLALGCASDCPPAGICSPAVIVTAELSTPAASPFEGSVRLCHRTSCLEAALSLEPGDPQGWEVTFEDSHTSARFAIEGDRWIVEAEVHPAGPEGYFAGDAYSVLIRDGAGDAVLTHEGNVADKLQNDACGLPCAIQHVDL
jgi:hypothetical protein